MATNTDSSTTKGYDLAHADALSSKQKSIVDHEANDFLESIAHYFDETYLHLDVKQIKEQKRNSQGFKWKVLLVTNRGRYHTEKMGFGVKQSITNAFDALTQQLQTRIEKLNDK